MSAVSADPPVNTGHKTEAKSPEYAIVPGSLWHGRHERLASFQLEVMRGPFIPTDRQLVPPKNGLDTRPRCVTKHIHSSPRTTSPLVESFISDYCLDAAQTPDVQAAIAAAAHAPKVELPAAPPAHIVTPLASPLSVVEMAARVANALAARGQFSDADWLIMVAASLSSVEKLGKTIAMSLPAMALPGALYEELRAQLWPATRTAPTSTEACLPAPLHIAKRCDDHGRRIFVVEMVGDTARITGDVPRYMRTEADGSVLTTTKHMEALYPYVGHMPSTKADLPDLGLVLARVCKGYRDADRAQDAEMLTERAKGVSRLDDLYAIIAQNTSEAAIAALPPEVRAAVACRLTATVSQTTAKPNTHDVRAGVIEMLSVSAPTSLLTVYEQLITDGADGNVIMSVIDDLRAGGALHHVVDDTTGIAGLLLGSRRVETPRVLTKQALATRWLPSWHLVKHTVASCQGRNGGPAVMDGIIVGDYNENTGMYHVLPAPAGRVPSATFRLSLPGHVIEATWPHCYNDHVSWPGSALVDIAMLLTYPMSGSDEANNELLGSVGPDGAADMVRLATNLQTTIRRSGIDTSVPVTPIQAMRWVARKFIAENSKIDRG